MQCADCRVHGLACWFDILFDGSVQPRWLTTAPGQPTTHWSAPLPSIYHPAAAIFDSQSQDMFLADCTARWHASPQSWKAHPASFDLARVWNLGLSTHALLWKLKLAVELAQRSRHALCILIRGSTYRYCKFYTGYIYFWSAQI